MLIFFCILFIEIVRIDGLSFGRSEINQNLDNSVIEFNTDGATKSDNFVSVVHSIKDIVKAVPKDSPTTRSLQSPTTIIKFTRAESNESIPSVAPTALVEQGYSIQPFVKPDIHHSSSIPFHPHGVRTRHPTLVHDRMHPSVAPTILIQQETLTPIDTGASYAPILSSNSPTSQSDVNHPAIVPSPSHPTKPSHASTHVPSFDPTVTQHSIAPSRPPLDSFAPAVTPHSVSHSISPLNSFAPSSTPHSVTHTNSPLSDKSHDIHNVSPQPPQLSNSDSPSTTHVHAPSSSGAFTAPVYPPTSSYVPTTSPVSDSVKPHFIMADDDLTDDTGTRRSKHPPNDDDLLQDDAVPTGQPTSWPTTFLSDIIFADPTPEPTRQPESLPSAHPSIQPVPLSVGFPTYDAERWFRSFATPTPTPVMTRQPTPAVGVAGKSWWFYTTARVCLWGYQLVPDDTTKLRVASEEVFDFVLRDRMGMDITDLIQRVVQGQGLWIRMVIVNDNSSWFVDDDMKATVPHRTLLDLQVWTTTEERHDKTAIILRRINTNPEIVLGAYHERSLPTVTSVSVDVLSRNTTTSWPFVSAAPSIYGHVKRIGWIIAGTLGIFIAVVAAISVCTLCWQRIGKGGSSYQQFQSNSGHDLEEFNVNEEEVTVELHQI